MSLIDEMAEAASEEVKGQQSYQDIAKVMAKAMLRDMRWLERIWREPHRQGGHLIYPQDISPSEFLEKYAKDRGLA